MCTTMRYHGGIGTGGRYHLYYHVYHVFLYRRRYFIDTIEQPDRTAGALKALNKINSSILVITGCNAHRCKMRMIETLASSSYRRRSGRAPDALKYGLQSGPRRVLSRHLHKSRRFSILF